MTTALRTLLPLLLVCLAVPALARTADAQLRPGVGDDARDFGEINWLINHPVGDSLEDLRGNVILLERFVYDQNANRQLIPKLQRLHEEFGARGLQVLSVGGEYSVEWDLIMQHRMHGATYPVGRGPMPRYPSGQVSIVWLIGPQGKVLYAQQASNLAQNLPRNSPQRQRGRGRPPQLHFDGLSEAVNEAMDDLEHPGFPIAAPTRDVAGYARSWSRGDFGRMRSQIKRELERGGDNMEQATREQFETLLARIDQVAEMHFSAAERYMQQGYFAAAQLVLEQVQDAFRREPESERAAELLESLESDEYEQEVEAAEALRAILRRIIPRAGQELDGASARRALESFAERNDGTLAAERARTLADQVEVQDD